MEIGVRDLKARLSSVLRAVERGELVHVTSRGRPVAEIVPAGTTTPRQQIDALIAAGTITPATKPWPTKPPPLMEPVGPLLPSEIVIAERATYYE